MSSVLTATTGKSPTLKDLGSPVVGDPGGWSVRERVVFLLEARSSVFDPDACSPFGSGSGGAGVGLMPLMSRHGSVVELERCLKVLLSVAAGDYRHLAAFRWGCEWRSVDRVQGVKGPGGRRVVVPVRVRERVLPGWLDAVRVDRAERFLVDRFRGPVELPGELVDALRLPADSAAWAAYDAGKRRRRLLREVEAA